MKYGRKKGLAVLLSVSLAASSFGVLPEKTGDIAAAAETPVEEIKNEKGFIEAVQQMQSVEGAKKHYQLKKDLDLSDPEQEFTQISNFSGIFDGGGHSIKGLKVQKTEGSETTETALFGSLEDSAQVKDLTLTEFERSVSKANTAGLLADKIQGNTKIENVTLKDSCIELDGGSDALEDASEIGLLAGMITDSEKINVTNVSIENSEIKIKGVKSAKLVGLWAGKIQGHVEVKGIKTDKDSKISVHSSVSEGQEIGGITGAISGQMIKQSENHAEITFENAEMLGGITGHTSAAKIQNCENRGKIIGKRYVGGIVGQSDGGTAVLTEVMNREEIEAKETAAGGIAGNAVGQILHAGNRGTVKTGVSLQEYIADQEQKPNPYIGGIAGKGSGSLVITNSYTAAEIGGISSPDVAFVFSTSSVEIKSSYYLGDRSEPTAQDDAVMTEEEFENGTVLRMLSDYGTAPEEKGTWTAEDSLSNYPTSYHAGTEGYGNNKEKVSVKFWVWNVSDQESAMQSYENAKYDEEVKSGTKYSELTFYKEVIKKSEKKYWVFAKGSFNTVKKNQKIEKNTDFYVWEYNASEPQQPPVTQEDDPEESVEPSPTVSPSVPSKTPDSSGIGYYYDYIPILPSETNGSETAGTSDETTKEETTKTETTGTSDETTKTETTGTPDETEKAETAQPEKTSAPVSTITPAEEKNTPLVEGEQVQSNGAVFKAEGKTSVSMEKVTDSNIQTAKIPDVVKAGGVTYKVTSIGAEAYAGCKKLKEVTIGKNVTEIDKGSFQNCTNLKEVKFPQKIKKISEGAFKNCKKLKSVALPAGVTSIGKACFKNCKSMKTFSVGEVKKKKKGVLSVSENQKVMYGGTPVTISIAANALENCVKLKQVIINSQVQKIGNAAFKQCTALSKIIVYSLILKKVGKKALMGVSHCKISVPMKKIKPYKVLFKNKGQGKKVVVAKM